MSTNAECNKVKYRSKYQAELALQNCLREYEQGNMYRKERSIYECPVCGAYHLSSTLPVNKATRIGAIGDLTVSVNHDGYVFVCCSWGQFPNRKNVRQYLTKEHCETLIAELRTQPLRIDGGVSDVHRLETDFGLAGSIKLFFVKEDEQYRRTEYTLWKEDIDPFLALIAEAKDKAK